jgi:PKD repeat protein
VFKKVFVLTLLVLILCIPASIVVQAAPTTTCTVIIDRAQVIDSIENILEGEADWYYKVVVTDNTGDNEITFNDSYYHGNDDVVFNQHHQFSVSSLSVTITIYLYEEDDIFADELADISSSYSRNSVVVYYNLKTNSFSGGDQIQREGAYYKTSGDFDGSTGIDENDANLWFKVTDNYDLPSANAGPDGKTSSGASLIFDASSCTASSGSEIETYQWDFNGDGIFDAEGVQISYTYSQKGNYVVILKITDNFGEIASDSCVISVNSPPVAAFSYSPTEPEVRDVIEFTDNSIDEDGILTSWYWQFGDGSVSSDTNPSYQYSHQGTYQVSLTVTDNDGAQNTKTISISVLSTYVLPVANAGPNREITSGDRINFDASSSTASEASVIERYQWDFDGDGVFDAEGMQTSFTYSEKGSFTVLLKVTDDYGETDIDTCTVLVKNSVPASQFTFYPAGPTILDVIDFSETAHDIDGTLTSWYWQFGDGNTSDARNPSHQYSRKGTYNVRLTVADNDGAQNTTTILLTVENLPPEADFVCPTEKLVTGETVQFVDNSTDPEDAIVTWLWDFGDGYTSTNQNSTHKFESEGNYQVTLVVIDDEDATDTHSKVFTIVDNVVPVANFVCNITEPLVGSEIAFEDSSEDPDGTVVSWEWDFGDGTNSQERKPVHIFKEPGEYNVTLTVTDDLGAEGTYIMNLEIEPTFIEQNLLLIIAIISAVVVLVVVLLVLRKRKKTPSNSSAI